MSALAIVLLSVAYGIAWLLVGCRVGTLMAWHFHAAGLREYTYIKQGASPDAAQWFGGMMLGLCAGCVWPLALCAFASRRVLFAPPRDVQAARQKAEIERLERELELVR